MHESSPKLANLFGALAIGIGDRIRVAALDRTALDETGNAAVVVVGHASGMSIDQLGCTLGRSHAGTVRLVDRITRAGLARRNAAADDRRKVALTLTKAGREYRSALLKRRQDTLRTILDELSANERAVLERVARRLLGTLAVDAASALAICRYCDESQCRDCPMGQFGVLE